MAKQLLAKNAKEASSSSSWLLFILKASLLLALLLLALSKFLCIMHYLVPLLTGVAMSLLHRLYDVLRFLVITTTLTVGILSSNKRNSKKDTERPLRHSSVKGIDAEVHQEHHRLHQRGNVAGEEGVVATPQQQQDPSPNESTECVHNVDPSLELKGVGITTGPTVFHGSEGQASSSSLRKGPHHQRARSTDAMLSDTIRGLDDSEEKSSARHSPSLLSKQPQHKRANSVDAMFSDTIESTNMLENLRGSTLVDANGPNGCVFENTLTVATWMGSNVSASVSSSRPTALAGTGTGNAASPASSQHPAPAPAASSPIKSKHSRSKSALDLQLESTDAVSTNLESKPAAPRRRRRGVTSVSCDFGRDKLISQWLCDLPSPPAPPPDIIADPIEHPPAALRQLEDPKAFIDSLVPWRSMPAAVTQEVEQQGESHGAFCASPNVVNSPRELGRKADAFIARFHQQMRLQRKESFERYKRRLQ